MSNIKSFHGIWKRQQYIPIKSRGSKKYKYDIKQRMTINAKTQKFKFEIMIEKIFWLTYLQCELLCSKFQNTKKFEGLKNDEYF